jgi:hypothetical protein
MYKIWLLCFVTILVSRDIIAQANKADFGNDAAWNTARAYTKLFADQKISPVYCSPLPGGGFNVFLKDSSISNLTVLTNMSIRVLDLSKTAVSDLSLLRGSKVEDLNIRDTKVTDLAPLKELSLVRLTFDPYNIKTGLNVLRGKESLSTITFRSKSTGNEIKLFARVFWARLAAGDIEKALTDE